MEKEEEKISEKDLNILLYKVTHDIKGPLSSIVGLANVGLMEISDENAKMYLKRIKSSTEKLHAFVSDLLNVTKITIKDADQERINFQELLDDILNSLQFIPNFKDIDININIQESEPFYSDSMMLYSIFQNIIENSIKYSDSSKPQSYLKIKIKSKDKKTIVEFEDNGIGIEDNLNEKVFEMFFRATDNSGGNGLGLYIVKKSIEKLNGTVTITSKLGEGTVTTVVFNHFEPVTKQ
ncbi:MAG: HAMP domain-containing sensor histidine kinase [Bacteroidota bacterium]|nr:HAMP domain-containing sensor histidine kinase [Bacteroidota bacterium]